MQLMIRETSVASNVTRSWYRI